MTYTVQVGKRDFSVALHPATVIHTDKYTDVRGGLMNFPVYSTLHCDVVFRSKQRLQDWPVHINGLNLPLYNNQDVSVIAVEETIIGFIDTNADLYYYTSTDFYNNFDLGIRAYKIWIAGIIAVIASFIFLPGDQKQLGLLALAATYFFYRAQKSLINYRAEKAMDKFLSSHC